MTTLNPNETNARVTISACYPSEIGPSVFGLLGSGTRHGSVTAYRGTSIATALPTRYAALAFLNSSGAGTGIGTERGSGIGQLGRWRKRTLTSSLTLGGGSHRMAEIRTAQKRERTYQRPRHQSTMPIDDVGDLAALSSGKTI